MLDNTFETDGILAFDNILKHKYTLPELAKEAGISSVTLASRLNRGCPLNVALLIPEDLNLECIDEDPNGTLHYEISSRVFYGTTEELFAYILQKELI